jgi:hypothetical protein
MSRHKDSHDLICHHHWGAYNGMNIFLQEHWIDDLCLREIREAQGLASSRDLSRHTFTDRDQNVTIPILFKTTLNSAATA